MSSKKSAAMKLAQCKQKILEEWENRVRQSILITDQLSRIELRNSLPEVLSVMVDTLSEPDAKRALFAREKILATGHGKTRAQEASYSLDQVIYEYQILHQVLFEVLESDGQTLGATERDLILDLITLSIRNAATEFKAVQDRQKEEIQENLRQANIAL